MEKVTSNQSRTDKSLRHGRSSTSAAYTAIYLFNLWLLQPHTFPKNLSAVDFQNEEKITRNISLFVVENHRSKIYTTAKLFRYMTAVSHSEETITRSLYTCSLHL